jgi:hypothetical protein
MALAVDLGAIVAFVQISMARDLGFSWRIENFFREVERDSKAINISVVLMVSISFFIARYTVHMVYFVIRLSISFCS